jgi:hypothetical protein
MIENRSRIEKQVLLGRQTVHKAYKGKSRSNSREPRQILLQKSLTDPIQHTGMPISTSHSGSDRPLSVDSDAEAAFIRGSPFFKRGRREPPADHEPDREGPTYMRRRRLEPLNPTADEAVKDGVQLANGEPQFTRQEPPSNIGFFSRLHAQSLTRLSLPFSYEYRRNSIPENKQGFTWSSGSSSDDDYPLDE